MGDILLWECGELATYETGKSALSAHDARLQQPLTVATSSTVLAGASEAAAARAVARGLTLGSPGTSRVHIGCPASVTISRNADSSITVAVTDLHNHARSASRSTVLVDDLQGVAHEAVSSGLASGASLFRRLSSSSAPVPLVFASARVPAPTSPSRTSASSWLPSWISWPWNYFRGPTATTTPVAASPVPSWTRPRPVTPTAVKIAVSRARRALADSINSSTGPSLSNATDFLRLISNPTLDEYVTPILTHTQQHALSQ